MNLPQKIRLLLESNRLEAAEPDDAAATALWRKALESWRDSRNESNALGNRYALAYQALLHAALTILSASGYRTRGGSGHREATFTAVAALGVPGLEELHIQTETIRRKRKVSVYEVGEPAPAELDAVDALLARVLPATHAWLAKSRPQLSSALSALPHVRSRDHAGE